MATPGSSASSSRSPTLSTPRSYRMHVSQRYLDLTRQKLEVTRLPREPPTAQEQWSFGVAKNDLEPLVDHWMEGYDWRAQETFYNDTLPQYRLSINGIRMHFVHRRSTATHAIPLLFVHGWPESFITAAHMIDSLCNPEHNSPNGQPTTLPSFHVVVPSIPGFGFTDPMAENGNNIMTTAELFDSLMKSLGYRHYIVHGSGWGYNICRMIALTHSESCLAVHASNINAPPPNSMDFAYPPQGSFVDGMNAQSPSTTPPMTPSHSQLPPERPQTIAYALCDSPAGLLAYIVDAIRPTQGSRRGTPSQSPRMERFSSSSSAPVSANWTPSALIDWTMIYWLPGPETPLRWLANSTPMIPMLWTTQSTVPLAISHYTEQSSPSTQPAWIDAYHPIIMVRRRQGSVRFPAWERPADMVHDLRELAALMAPAFFA